MQRFVTFFFVILRSVEFLFKTQHALDMDIFSVVRLLYRISKMTEEMHAKKFNKIKKAIKKLLKFMFLMFKMWKKSCV